MKTIVVRKSLGQKCPCKFESYLGHNNECCVLFSVLFIFSLGVGLWPALFYLLLLFYLINMGNINDKLITKENLIKDKWKKLSAISYFKEITINNQTLGLLITLYKDNFARLIIHNLNKKIIGCITEVNYIHTINNLIHLLTRPIVETEEYIRLNNMAEWCAYFKRGYLSYYQLERKKHYRKHKKYDIILDTNDIGEYGYCIIVFNKNTNAERGFFFGRTYEQIDEFIDIIIKDRKD